MIGPFIFLDIDGVLNAHKPHANGYCGMDRESVAMLNRIIDETGAKVIVSSAWRYFVLRGEMNVAGLGGLLCTHGLKWGCVIDVLGPDIPDGNGGADRGAAIEEWFRSRWGVAHAANWIALDDMDLGYSRRKMPFFQTRGDLGLAGSVSYADLHNVIIATLRGRE